MTNTDKRTDPSLTIQAAFTQITNALATTHSSREAASIAHIIIEHITGMGKLDRIVYKDSALTTVQENQLQDSLKALLQQQPVQYVTGKSWFYGMELQVNNQVLIPRPETEELVEWIVNDRKINENEAVSILDIGTGSGAIPLALKKELPQAGVWAVDVSTGALEIAALNASHQKLDIHFAQMDVLDTAATAGLPQFDIIVSNPPYICQSEQADMQQQVLAHEPSLALFVPDNDALLFYRRIGLLAKQKLSSNGMLYFEINEAFGKEVVTLLQQQGFSKVTLKQDMFGKDRMVKCVNS